MSAQGPKTYHFEEVTDPSQSKNKMGKPFYRLIEDMVEVLWGEGQTSDYQFDYPGRQGGWMMFPIPGLFDDGNGNDQVFPLPEVGGVLELTLQSKDAVQEANPGLDLEGHVILGLTVYDNEHKSFAEKKSPPPIKLGP